MTRRRSRRGHATRPVPERHVGPPTVVSLDWDHCYDSVLEDRSPGVGGVELLDPADLGLSPPLVERLAAWLRRQDAASARMVREEPETEETRRAAIAAARELLTLAHDVQHELGPDVEVLLHGRPLGEHRRP